MANKLILKKSIAPQKLNSSSKSSCVVSIVKCKHESRHLIWPIMYTHCNSAKDAMLTWLLFMPAKYDGHSPADRLLQLFSGYLLSIKTVDLIITLVTIEHVLQSRLPLATFLQSKEATTTTAQLQQERADPEV